ncbi:MAG: hypothetical protein II972_01810 [Elusimicrobiaceae bacterium]|nr:hypothetical protein [Elusimicrobiaceae bacterium]
MKLCGYVVLKEEEYANKLREETLDGFNEGFWHGINLSILAEGGKMNDKKEVANTCEEAQLRCGQPDRPDWKNRFRIEYHEVKARYTKLHNIIVKIEAGTCDFKPNCGLDLLKRQAKAMGEYLFVLEMRAQIENIPLV